MIARARGRVRRLAWTFAVTGAIPSAMAEPAPGAAADTTRYEFFVRGETHAELFRRTLLPGANGATVTTTTLVPIRQYVLVRARELEYDARAGAVDFELAGWGSAFIGDSDPDVPLDGDIQTANVGYRRGHLTLRLGRQHAAGGAARFVRFDGVDLGADLGEGFEARGYAGFSVLPRWDQQPGYHYLGAAVDSRLRDANALPEPDRGSRWLAGAGVGWHAPDAGARVSFHEQHAERGLARRNLGIDGRARVLDEALVGATGLLDLDAARLADARLYGDLTPFDGVLVSLEFLHTEPALFLSRDSVLSVFSTSSYDEAGASASARLDRLTLEGAGFAQVYSDGEPGGRGELALRVAPDGTPRSLVRVGWARVLAPTNGYHSLRVSVARRMATAVSGTLEGYAYFYDAAIRGLRVSSVYAGTLTYHPDPIWSALVGLSLAQSPYARFDAQAQLALAYAFDFVTERREP